MKHLGSHLPTSPYTRRAHPGGCVRTVGSSTGGIHEHFDTGVTHIFLDTRCLSSITKIGGSRTQGLAGLSGSAETSSITLERDSENPSWSYLARLTWT